MDIYKVNAELMAKRNQVISLNGEIARKNVEIACNLEQIKRKDEEISRKNEEISIKDKAVNSTYKRHTLNEIDQPQPYRVLISENRFCGKLNV